MDLSKKFLYINPDATSGEEDSAISYPASSLAAIDCTAADTVNLFFKDANLSDTTNVVLTIASGKEKEVIQTIVEAINYSKGANIVIADDSSSEYISSHIASVAVPSLGDTEYNFQGAIVSNLGNITATSGDFVATSGTLDVKDGGAVTQASNRTTGVTLNKLAGKVTGNAATLAAVTIAAHTVTNSTVAANDVVIVSKVSGDANTSVYVDAVGAGSFNVAVRNNHASGNDSTALVYNFVVIKGSNS